VHAGHDRHRRTARHAGLATTGLAAAIPDTWLATTEGQGRRFCAPGGCPEVIYVQRLTAGSDPIFTITSGGKEYFVQMTALSATWDRSQPIFRAFFATFRPAN
jgi:hypothetical protein